MTDGVLLIPSGVCSKWGFEDGDVLSDVWLDAARDGRLPASFNLEHRTLRALVRKHIEPLFDGRVVLYDIDTSHNPIRAASIDGEEWDEYGNPDDDPAWIEALPAVRVGVDEIIEVARSIVGADDD